MDIFRTVAQNHETHSNKLTPGGRLKKSAEGWFVPNAVIPILFWGNRQILEVNFPPTAQGFLYPSIEALRRLMDGDIGIILPRFAPSS